MEKILKALKIHKCEVCNGNIQRGEKYIRIKLVLPKYDDNYKQIGIQYFESKTHKSNCSSLLINSSHPKEIIKNCNFGVHSEAYDAGPDSYDNAKWCEWCGIALI